MITPQLSGWCQFPETKNPEGSHARCTGGNTARPTREFQPCPCSCHYSAEFECGNCGLDLSETVWSEDDEMVYTHLDPKTGHAIGEECP